MRQFMTDRTKNPKGFATRLASLSSSGPVSADDINQAARDFGVTKRAVKAGVLRLGGTLANDGRQVFDQPSHEEADGTEQVQSEEDWEQKHEALKKEIKARFRHTGIDENSIAELSNRYGKSRRAVIAAVAALGVRLVSTDDHSLATASPNQYGVLQGLANATGGCASLWGVIFLIIAVVLAIYAIKEMFLLIF